MRLYNQQIHSDETEQVPVIPPREPFDWNTVLLLLAICCLILFVALAVFFFMVLAPGWN